MRLAGLRVLLRQTKDALTLYPVGPDDAPHRVHHQYLGRTSRCKVLRHLFLRCWILRLVPRRYRMVCRARQHVFLLALDNNGNRRYFF